MKKWSFLSGFVVLTAVLGGCTSAYYTSAGYAGDDLYATHDKVQIARRQQQEAEARKAAAEARRAEWEARIAEAEALAAQNEYEGTLSGGRHTYSSVLADTYESAYARRLRGFESPTYRMPSSYYNFRYGDAFTYVSAYDPAFYNIVVSGDQVWVEPKYISSMFGTWGATVYTGNWYGGWGFGSSWWRYPSWGWNWGFAYHPWHDPWHRPVWGSVWGPAWGPAGWHGHADYRRPHNYRLDSYSRPNNNGWRQSVGTANSRNEGYGRGYNTGRTGSYNNSGRGNYNNRGTGTRNNTTTRPSTNDRNNNTTRPSGNNDRNNNSYNSGRGSSYNSGRSNSDGFSGGSRSGGSSSGNYGGGSSSGGGNRGGGSYNRGR